MTPKDTETRLRGLLKAEAERAIDLCARMVRIPSENPPGDTRDIARFSHEYLEGAGLECRTVAPQEHMPNVVATVKGDLPGPHVVFNGHLDTFPVADRSRWNYDPFGGRIEGGRLYGRGACDMKGGLSASMIAASLLARVRDQLPGRVTITLVSDEETGSRWGARYLLETHQDLWGDALINGEPSSPFNFRVGEKGMFWFRFRSLTPGGHGAYVKIRQNAIQVVLNLLRDLLAFGDRRAPVPRVVVEMMNEAHQCFDGLLGPGATDACLSASANVGTIAGGTVVNMVPEHCEVEVDFRLPAGVPEQYLRDFLAEVMIKHPGCDMEQLHATPATLTDPGSLLVSVARRTAEEIRSHPVYPTISIGGTDCRHWRLRGVPAIVYGPHQHNMGSADEYIEVAELPDVVAMQTLTAYRFLTGWPSVPRR
jgi:succinyl-diaminopimelate desuccinylase